MQLLPPRVIIRPLGYFAASWGAWVTADAASLVVLSVIAYSAGGLSAVGVVGAARVLPAAIAAPWGAILTDRYPRVRILAAMHVVGALQLLALGLAAALHESLPVLCALVALGALLSALARPATSALVPQLVAGPDELTGANALASTTEAAATLLGPALAGVLLVAVAPPMACVVVALVSLAGAAVTLGIKPAACGRPVEVLGAGRRLRELVAGVEALLGERRVAAIFGLFMAQAVMRGLLNVFVVAAAVSLLGLGEAGAGGLLSLLGLGGLLGAGLSMGVAAGRRLALPFAAGVAAWGLAVLAIAAWPAPGVAWLALAGLGLGNAVEDVAGLTLLHRLIPDHRLGRFFGVFWGVVSASVAAGSLGAPALIALFGVRGAMALSGAMLVVLVLAVWGQVRQPDEGVADGRPAGVRLSRRRTRLGVLPRPGLVQGARSVA
jgi:MFS family permease